MKRREFLLGAVGAGGAAAAVGGQASASPSPAAGRHPGELRWWDGRLAQQDNAENDGPVEEIEVGDNYFDPEELTIEVGTTVRWVWVGDIDHNVNPTSQPDDADWDGHPDLQREGEYEFTFEVVGTYEYTCDPHPGMDGVIEVVEADEPEEEVIEIGDNYFDPEDLTIEVGTTVRWVWVGDIDHNVNPTSQPDGADWEGHPELQTEGEYEFTFTVPGVYEYTCDPHPGMDGRIEVVEEVAPPAPAPPEFDPHEVGVPLQKHFIGIATFFAIALTIVFTFYVLKYGETPHSGSPNRK